MDYEVLNSGWNKFLIFYADKSKKPTVEDAKLFVKNVQEHTKRIEELRLRTIKLTGMHLEPMPIVYQYEYDLALKIIAEDSVVELLPNSIKRDPKDADIIVTRGDESISPLSNEVRVAQAERAVISTEIKLANTPRSA